MKIFHSLDFLNYSTKMDKTSGYQNQIFTEVVDPSSQRSSLTYDEANDLTLTPYNNENNNNHNSDLEKVSTVKTEKYDAEAGGLSALETHKTSNYRSAFTQYQYS